MLRTRWSPFHWQRPRKQTLKLWFSLNVGSGYSADACSWTLVFSKQKLMPQVSPGGPHHSSRHRPSGAETSFQACHQDEKEGTAGLSLASGLCRCVCGQVRVPARGTRRPRVGGSGRQGLGLWAPGVAALGKGDRSDGPGPTSLLQPRALVSPVQLSVSLT